ncbi:glycoside hydrolase domain-containing protein, partial [Escherichia coli]|uniref:glycoside hydrolase domain-containing protein n=1 Tax=Escherichia coli TaxID=562 RepID=UPI003F816829
MDWLVRKTGISGVYMDGIGMDRRVMRRVRRVLQDRVGGEHSRVEVHGANGRTARGGYASTVVEHMESLPFVDRVWYGD